MEKTIGFIGNGNMGGAMLAGIMRAGFITKEQIYVSATKQARLAGIQEMYGVHTTLDNKEVARNSDYLILAIKPHQYEAVIDEICDDVKKDVVIINIAAGQSIENISRMFSRDMKVVKAMPNTPALVQEAMSALAYNDRVSSEELADVLTIFNSFGKVEIVNESLMDAVTAVSGSSPAYVFMFLEALADGAVSLGMSRDQAYTFAAQAVLGSAKMLLESGKHPGVLKDGVCSPNGTTIEAVKKLEQCGFRSAVLEAMQACSDRSKAMKQ